MTDEKFVKQCNEIMNEKFNEEMRINGYVSLGEMYSLYKELLGLHDGLCTEPLEENFGIKKD